MKEEYKAVLLYNDQVLYIHRVASIYTLVKPFFIPDIGKKLLKLHLLLGFFMLRGNFASGVLGVCRL